jgi:16S rRNA (cytidine1402-2'-O)-methyltransferase
VPADPLPPGLYLVATPIGNLDDITLRALDTLKRAARIACEDTRQTQKLLNHFSITTPTISCHEHNERDRAVQLISDIHNSGAAVAVVSDAGMPGISDPGSLLVKEAIAAGVPVIPIPGANAGLSALVASGLPASEFHFVGFLPEKAGARRTRLEDLASALRSSAQTLILYEAPHRVLETLSDLEAVWSPALRIVAARELTKIHEEFLRGTVTDVRQELASRDRVRGEFVLLFEAPAGPASSLAVDAPGLDPETRAGSPVKKETIGSRIAQLQSAGGMDEKEALKRVARELGQSKSEVYRELQRERARRR